MLRVEKIGRFKLSRKGGNPYQDGKWVSGRVKHEADGWYAYLVYEVSDANHVLAPKFSVGIDRNVGQIAMSDGAIIKTPKPTALAYKRRRYQRRMARQQHPTKKQQASKRYLKSKYRHALGMRQDS